MAVVAGRAKPPTLCCSDRKGTTAPEPGDEVRRKWWALMVTSLTGSLLFQHTAQHLSASADSRKLPLRWLIITMGWKLFRTLCLQNNSKK